MSDSMAFRAGWLYLHDGDTGRPVRVRVEHVSALREYERHDQTVRVFVMTTGGSLIDVCDSLAEVEKEHDRARNAAAIMVPSGDALLSMFLGNRPTPPTPEEVRAGARRLLEGLPKKQKARRKLRRQRPKEER